MEHRSSAVALQKIECSQTQDAARTSGKHFSNYKRQKSEKAPSDQYHGAFKFALSAMVGSRTFFILYAHTLRSAKRRIQICLGSTVVGVTLRAVNLTLKASSLSVTEWKRSTVDTVVVTVDLIMDHGKMIISNFPRNNLARSESLPCLGPESVAPPREAPWETNYFLDQGTRGPKIR